MNKLLTLFVGAVLSVSMTIASAPPASASALGDAFGSLNTVTNDAGPFKSQVRSGVMLGSGRLRTNANIAATPLGINIVPPSLDVGCNGIDWHFGGLSWINGENIERMLEAAGPAALMFVIKLAINALCEDCAEELGKIVDALQRAANASMNACQLGENLVTAGLDYATNDKSCQRAMAQTGKTDNMSAARAECDSGSSLFNLRDLGFSKTVSDFSDGLSSAIGSASSAINSFVDGVVNPLDQGVGQDKLENNKKLNIGNPGWQALARAGIVMTPADLASLKGTTIEGKAKRMFYQSMTIGELFLSAMTYDVKTGKGDGKKDPVPKQVHATLKPKEMLQILECGANYFAGHNPNLPTEAANQVKDICNAMFEAQGTVGPSSSTPSTIKIRSCSSDNNADPDVSITNWIHCYSEAGEPVAKIDANLWAMRGYVQDTLADGTLGIAIGRLWSISRKIAGDTGFSCATSTTGYGLSDEPGASKTTLCPEEIALLNNAPFPLYKVVNLAALFPALRPQLFETYGKILGLMMAQDYLEGYVRSSRQFASTQSAGSDAQREVNRMLNKQITSVEKGLNKALDVAGQQIQRANVLTSQILSLEQHLRDDIFDRQILGNQAFAQSVTTAAYQEDPQNNNP